ncbi:hypothetical protein QBC40DRAFT_224495 [Triangularia verruculosa]|uniref:Uncharacterized protein n=1 Tax=Triangularia verruculosa TaxID=2587418 RepID=A0AAN6XNA3_9PEZI|nr:hypothetical protein QBC40DRAFT_224495 [Triangularia verruculosa]
MAEDIQVVYDHLIAFSVFAVFTFLLTVLGIRKRSGLARLKLLSVVPYSVSAALTTRLYNAIRDQRYPRDFQPYLNRLTAAYGILSVVGVFLATWALIMWLVLGLVKERAPGREKKRRRSSFYFYVLTVDIAITGCLVAGIALSSTFVPWNIKHCDDPVYLDSKFISGIRVAYRDENNGAACRRGLTIHAMAAVAVTLIIAQCILLLPWVNLPNGIRFVIYQTIRIVKRPVRHSDVELGDLESRSQVLREEISKQIEQLTHYSDVVSTLSSSVAFTSTEYLEILAERCCGEDKSQCWACDAMICAGCKVLREKIPVPRTTHHITDCYAICTGCYLMKWSSKPAAFSAAFNSTNLTVQHDGCSRKQTGTIQAVKLCRRCSEGTLDQIRDMREAREQKLLAKTVVRRLLCSMCERPIPKEKRRWWICGSEDHECHWAGHEV